MTGTMRVAGSRRANTPMLVDQSCNVVSAPGSTAGSGSMWPAGKVSTAPPARSTPATVRSTDAKFGMFIHWGVYSVLGDGEWVMNNRHMPIEDYETLPQQFNPVDFNAAEWVAIAKAAGAKYITITSKHHDGFAMFATRH